MENLVSALVRIDVTDRRDGQCLADGMWHFDLQLWIAQRNYFHRPRTCPPKAIRPGGTMSDTATRQPSEPFDHRPLGSNRLKRRVPDVGLVDADMSTMCQVDETPLGFRRAETL